MKPSPDVILNQTFAKVAFEMGPALPAGYGQGSATITGVLLLMVAQEFNRAADIRAKENTVMRAIFRGAAKGVAGDLGARLKAVAESEDADLNVATLDRANGELKKLLIELQAHAEEAGDIVLTGDILTFLRDAAAARQVFLPAM